jgi:hypothetical protein
VTAWEFIWAAVGWVLAVVLVIIVLVIAAAILWGTWLGVKGWLKKPTKPAPDDYIKEAQVLARDLYKDEIIMPQELAMAFERGARWGWDALHR